MTEDESFERIEFVPMTGSPVMVGRRTREERIREAMMDLRLVFEGTGSMVSGSSLPAEGRRIEMTAGLMIADLTASLARHCSLFLRKMVWLNPDSSTLEREYMTRS